MPTPPVPPAKQAEVRRLLAQGLNHRKIAKLTGISTGSVSNIASDNSGPTSSANTAEACVLERAFTKPIRTLEEAVRAFEIDESVWIVDRWNVGGWTVGMKFGATGAERAVQEQQYTIKLYLRRIMPKAVHAATDAIFERMARHAPKYPKPAKVKGVGEAVMAVPCLFDAHFGKLCWAAETGDNYDLKTAETIYANAVADLLAEASNRNVQKFLFPIGNDFFHMDNSRNTTYAGTPQDVDGRYPKVIEAGEMASVYAVEGMAAVAPVEIKLIPGNHDPTAVYHLGRTLKAWFRNHPNVTVDTAPSPRKYVRWGCNLIGLTHGNEEKIADLPSLMATERPKEWAGTICREWLLGHQHRSRSWQTHGVDTHQGTVIRVLLSLSGCDAWHHRKGYIQSPVGRAAECYFYGHDRGYLGHAVASARFDTPIKRKRAG